MARTLVMMAKLMPQVSACTKDRDEDLASDPTQRMETGSEIASYLRIFMFFEANCVICIT